MADPVSGTVTGFVLPVSDVAGLLAGLGFLVGGVVRIPIIYATI